MLDKSTRPPSAEEEFRLLKGVTEGNMEARNELLTRNLRLLSKIVKGYKGKGVPLEDLWQEGFLAMVHTLDRYAIKPLPYRCTTLFKVAIRTNLHHFIKREHQKGIYVMHPQTIKWGRKWIATAEQMRADLGYEPTPDEIATQLKIDDRKRKNVERAAKILTHRSSTGTIVTQSQDHYSYQTDIDELLEPLSAWEREIVIRWAGLNGSAPRSLSNILHPTRFRRKATVIHNIIAAKMKDQL